jgi:signal transduction histidine kinase
MKKGIVLKLFLLTTAFCTLILSTIFIGQMLFFKVYYLEKKTNELIHTMKDFQKSYQKDPTNIQAIVKLKNRLATDHNTWMTILDHNGNIVGENDFNIKITSLQTKPPVSAKSEKEITIPLYNMNINNFWRKQPFKKNDTVSIWGIQKENILIPIFITLEGRNHAPKISINTEVPLVPFAITSDSEVAYKNTELEEQVTKIPDRGSFPFTAIMGPISNITVPSYGEVSKAITTNDLFLQKIREFQANILFHPQKGNDFSLQKSDYEKNGIKYKLLVQPFKNSDGNTEYVFTMSSLQPLDEAFNMMQGYYIYLIVFVLILIILASFYYSRKIAKPLLRMNQTTEKIANLDFTEQLPITSKDEIGSLSQNINKLSSTLQSYIGQLKQDIEKERQLEKTRKQFISGVSHELKTPLSVMQSCLSILKDGVAVHKKEYYFSAMEKEVEKMDQLIVDMLELAKLESGTYKIKMEPFYINELLAYTCKILSLELGKKELQLKTNFIEAKVIGNENRIEQVITNMMMNAIRHTPNGEWISITITDENDKVKIGIENKGEPIANEELDKIWDRFYRGDPSRQRSQGGTGLGLSISKNILELHDVDYGVKNTENGVLFYFYLNKASVVL